MAKDANAAIRRGLGFGEYLPADPSDPDPYTEPDAIHRLDDGGNVDALRDCFQHENEHNLVVSG